MKLRATIVLLAGLALLLGAAQPQPNSEHPRDARKLRYSERQALTNDGAGSESNSDPNAPLSLLPAGAQPDEIKELPNAAPKPGELADGVTATGSLETAPAESAGTTTSGVRSLAIDGAPYGEVRRKVVKQPALAAPQQAMVAKADQSPTLRGMPTAPNPAAAPSTKPVTAETKIAANTAPAKPAKQPAPTTIAKQTAPVKKDLPDPKKATAPAKPVTVATSKEPSVTKSAPPPQDEFKWLSRQLGRDVQASNVSAGQLRHDAAATAAAEDEHVAGSLEPIAGRAALDESLLEPLSIPGDTVARAAPGRLAKALLGAAAVLALLLIAVVIPRPQRRRSEDGLTLIETIEIEGDRELVILRKKHYALVLGVTRSATHLLEKVSMASLDSDYSTVINSIIKRESESPELWRMRPLFSSSWRVDCAPEERAAPARRTSLTELRASLQVVGPARVTSAAPAVRATMSDLRSRGDASVSGSRRASVAGPASRDAVICRLREQARRAS